MRSTRATLLVSALRLSFFTITWNGVVGAAALVVSFIDGSLALAGFALNALLDSAASAVLVWRFRKEQRDPIAAERLELRAQAWIVVAMLLVALYVGVEAVRALVGGSHPEASAFGVILAGVSLVVLPWLGRLKLRVASDLSSQALRGDGILTLAAAALAAITLVALLVNSAFEWWWADPTAALLIATALAVEATCVAVRHRFGWEYAASATARRTMPRGASDGHRPRDVAVRVLGRATPTLRRRNDARPRRDTLRPKRPRRPSDERAHGEATVREGARERARKPQAARGERGHGRGVERQATPSLTPGRASRIRESDAQTWWDSCMCCGVNGDELIVRVDPAHEHEAFARPHARPIVTGRPMRGFVTVRPAGLRGDGLDAWVQEVVGWVESLPPKQADDPNARG